MVPRSAQIRVETPQALGWYVRKLDYELFRREESDDFATDFIKPEGAAEEAMAVELTYNYDGRSYEMGDAWGHLAVQPDDLHDAGRR